MGEMPLSALVLAGSAMSAGRGEPLVRRRASPSGFRRCFRRCFLFLQLALPLLRVMVPGGLGGASRSLRRWSPEVLEGSSAPLKGSGPDEEYDSEMMPPLVSCSPCYLGGLRVSSNKWD